MARKKKGAESPAESIKRGLGEAVDIAKGRRKPARVHRVEVPALDVAEIRRGLDMTQERFAATFGIPLRTLHKWEGGYAEPSGTARAYLSCIAHEPDAVQRALDKAAPRIVTEDGGDHGRAAE